MPAIRGLLAVLLFSAAPATAGAEMLDMSTVTCGAVAEMSEDEAAFLFTWLHGYNGGLSGDTTMDFDTWEASAQRIGEVCQESPELSLMNAVDRAAEDEE
jgi:hypothetical protein